MADRFITVGLDCTQGSDDPSRPKRYPRFEWGNLDGVVFTLSLLPKPMTHRRPRPLRGGKTQPAYLRPTFRAWIPDQPMVVARGVAQFSGTA